MARPLPRPTPPPDDAPEGCVCAGCCCTRGGSFCRTAGCSPCLAPTTAEEVSP